MVEVGDHGTAITLNVFAPLRLSKMGELVRDLLHARGGVQCSIQPTVSFNLLWSQTGWVVAEFSGQLRPGYLVPVTHDSVPNNVCRR